MNPQTIHLKVQQREGVLYDDDVTSITSFNDVGEFDVLRDHANFISLIKNKLIIRGKSDEPQQIKFDNALLRVTNNLIEVYIGVEGVFNTANIGSK